MKLGRRFFLVWNKIDLKLKFLIVWLTLFAVVCTANFHLVYMLKAGKPTPKATNYFLDSSEIESAGFLVDTKFCKILNFPPFHKSALPFIGNATKFDCGAKYGRLTFTRKNILVLNETAVKILGYSKDSISCCYKTIFRVEQNFENFDFEADRRFRFSEECHRLTDERTPVKAEFIKVFCYRKYFFLFDDLIYTNYHAFAQSEKSENVSRKIQFWKKKKGDKTEKTGREPETPPNILILGLDSVSRLNFIRHLNKTRKFLQDLGSIEMSGYTKVGENTFPNAIPFTTGHSEEEFKKICWNSYESPMDDCPFIWKRFSAANYLTGFLEDSPVMATFHYLKTGFVRQPVDYYLRPFMLPIYAEKNFVQFGTFQRYSKKCAGSEAPYEKIFQYFESLLEMSGQEKVPLFLYSWTTGLSHDSMNDLQTADDTLADLLQRIDLNNSILLVMGDHGFRFGDFRETPIGWFEDKLPWLSIFLPPIIKLKFPEWVSALQTNSRRLLTPFDVYHTFSHLLDEFTPTETVNFRDESKSGQLKFGQSLLRLVPDSRTCPEAGISPSYCACSAPAAIPLDSPELKEAASFVVKNINAEIPSQCSQLQVKEVTAGARFTVGQTQNPVTGSEANSNLDSTYIVGFTVRPGDFRFEATVNFHGRSAEQQQSKGKVKVKEIFPGSTSILGDVLRVSKYNTNVNCVKESRIQAFCYCL